MTFNNVRTFAVLAIALLLTIIPLSAQSAPSGGCSLLPNGNSVMFTVGSTVFYCPPTGTGALNWAQLPRLAPTELTLNSTGLHVERMARAVYSFAVDGGVVGAITPATNFTLPVNAVITNVAINSTTALTSGGSATIAVGFTAGAAANSLKAATAVASYSANAFVQGVPVPQTASTWLKLTAAGQASITVAVAALTAGVLEIDVWYYVPAA